MTKTCTLKEAFIEKQLDKFQPDWRNGEDITAETKQKIKDYVSSQMPDELKESASCITDYSIWHMAKKIRKRENLPEPKKSNKGMPVVAPTDSGLQKSSSEVSQQVSERKPQTEKVSKCEPKIEEKPTIEDNQKKHKQEPEEFRLCGRLAAGQEQSKEHTKLSFDDVVEKLIELIELSSLNTIKSAIEAIEHDEGLMASASIKPTEALVAGATAKGGE